MDQRWAVVAALVFLPAFSTLPLEAQGSDPLWADGVWNYRVEFFGDVAHGSFRNGSRTWGSGLDLGGGVGVRPFSGRLRGLGFEARFAHVAEEKGNPATLATNLEAKMIAVNALYHFRGRTRVQPFVYGGLGVPMVKYWSVCNTCVYTAPPSQGGVAIPQRSNVTTKKAGLNLGAGVKIGVSKWFSVRPEFSYLNTTPGAGWNFSWLRFQLGLGLHF